MKYCKNCSTELHDEAVICPSCGVQQEPVVSKQVPNDNGGIGWGCLGFCIPLVGLILYLVWKDEKPKTAKAAGMGALIGFSIWALSYMGSFISGMF